MLNLQNQVSNGAIEKLFHLDLENKENREVDYIFQVLTLKTSETKQAGKHITTITLSDTINKRSGFVFIHNEEKINLKVYDLVRVKILTPNILKKDGTENVIFIVKSFELFRSCDMLFGSPQDYKYTKLSKISESNNCTTNPSSAESNRSAPRTNFAQISSFNHSSSHDIKSFPLSALSTFSKDFTVLVKITKKTDLKSYTNNKGDGCLFGFTMLDKEGSEMEGTAFNQVAKRVNDIMKKDKVYTIRGAYIKINDKKYSTVKSDYRMILDDNVEILEIEDDFIDENNIKLVFTKISDIENISSNEAVEVLGKVIEIGEPKDINTKNGLISLRKIKIVDSSDTSIEISLWRQHAQEQFIKGEIYAFKNIKVSNYNNIKTLNTIENTIIIRDPDVCEKTELLMHFNKHGDYNIKSLSNKQGGEGKKSSEISFLTDVVKSLDESDYLDKMPVFKVKANIVGFTNQEKNFYLGCIDCNKKITDDSSQCNSCNKTQDKENYIYSFSFRIKDPTGEEFVDIFGNLAEKIIGLKCEDYRDLFKINYESKLKQLQNEINYKQFYFLLKPKLNTFNNQTRKRIVVLRIDPVDSTSETSRLVDKINQALC